MEGLLIVIIGTVLLMSHVISVNVYLVISIFGIVWTFIAAGLYFKFGFMKFWYHDVLDWHTPDDKPQHHDGCSYHATCKYCGKDIMQDSQGNWF